ncbi:MAG: hypothetical protein N3E36_06105 [Sulfolobales archaeon]|nr:hypothetical protein [Sulfolobales archaeon]MCX8199578.1 hypothetical protein [Sulfolobales archaeon]MDW8170531.1 hypothetical protein [Desulfurococcaceae archaeon]
MVNVLSCYNNCINGGLVAIEGLGSIMLCKEDHLASFNEALNEFISIKQVPRGSLHQQY